MSTTYPSLCRRCGLDTTPCTGRRGCRHIGRWEWYMVRPAVWEAAGGGDGFLCIGCLEALIGRPLMAADFPLLPVNIPDRWDTERLAAARRRRQLWPPARYGRVEVARAVRRRLVRR